MLYLPPTLLLCLISHASEKKGMSYPASQRPQLSLNESSACNVNRPQGCALPLLTIVPPTWQDRTHNSYVVFSTRQEMGYT